MGILNAMRSHGQWLIIGVFSALLVCIAGALSVYVHLRAGGAAAIAQYKTPQEAGSVYVRFDMEAYDLIQQHYWQAATDTDMATLFQLSVEKAAASSSVALLAPTRAGVAAMLDTVFNTATSTEGARQLALNTLIVALYNLAPTGRDQLLSQAQETSLRQEVSNVNPSNDLYANLGVPASATPQQINEVYKQKAATATSSEAKQQLSYAHEVLANANDKARYDQAHVEPTVFAHVIGRTLYLYVSQMAPTTVQEFAEAVDEASTTPGLLSMVLDLRGNIGGALDFGQYFLGLFQGQNQYAFDLYHQGDYQVQRTVAPRFAELDRYREIAVLTDDMTQSTAELVAAAFKRLHLGYTVGTTTRGWGSVEDTYPLMTQIDPAASYALLLVNSLTLRDDNLPIESNGVVPNVATADTAWRAELQNYFTSSSLISAIEKTIVTPPQK